MMQEDMVQKQYVYKADKPDHIRFIRDDINKSDKTINGLVKIANSMKQFLFTSFKTRTAYLALHNYTDSTLK
ncbi:hypothetical protein M5W70_06350 [Paenibacillus larvae]|uniref:Uncharacterized protein n=3 Tax=Paenibacillus larvae TaxID=1464 RepID=A0AAP5JTB0_9BACL|nr:hypothetical protein [Paenibacillus larvae]MCY9688339.1 hypothetical protein [Paenibacillus larvae]MDT2251462.1 hypothetical protein [Paenibacillus larvae]MDV3485115.1 hypothetical protein [Paenibacillus larvae]